MIKAKKCYKCGRKTRMRPLMATPLTFLCKKCLKEFQELIDKENSWQGRVID